MDATLPLYRCEDIRVFESHAINHDAIDAYALMGRAAAATFASLQRHWPRARRLAVVCGHGNNGGDGFVLARLAHMAGLEVQVIVTRSEAPLAEPAARAWAHWREAGGVETVFDPTAGLPDVDVLVDGLLGIGLSRAPTGLVAQLIEAINASAIPVLAIDVPSGLDADRGSTPGVAVQAERTVSFIAAKRGLYTGRGRALAGQIELASLDVPIETRSSRPPAAWLWQAPQLRQMLSARARDAHKGRHGHVLAIGGDHGFGGAIRLCAEAALRSGSGLVSVATRSVHVAALLAARPEAMVQAVALPQDLTSLCARATVMALGPGLGRSDWSRSLFQTALASKVPMVIDADGLNLLAEAGLRASGHVLTPHPGEAARLLGVDVHEVEHDRFAAVATLAQQHEAVVVLKGAGTLVTGPDAVPVLIGAGNPGMASGGMGDVLTGVIASLWGQGMMPFQAACTGALLHSAAADVAVRDGGERGLLASDLFPHLRRLANP